MKQLDPIHNTLAEMDYARAELIALDEYAKYEAAYLDALRKVHGPSVELSDSDRKLIAQAMSKPLTKGEINRHLARDGMNRAQRRKAAHRRRRK